MADNSNIEWCDATWQVTHGCRKIAAGCANCYAIRDAHRMAGNPNPKISGPRQGLTEVYTQKSVTVRGIPKQHTDWTGVVRTAPENLDWPLRKKKPLRIFVNSNSDLFHEDVPFEFIAAVYGVMAACPQHTFMVLTKRPERMLAFHELVQSGDLREKSAAGTFAMSAIKMLANDVVGHVARPGVLERPYPVPNVWHGVSVAEQKDADKNIPILLQVPSAIRFVSAEPLIGPVGLRFHVQQWHWGDPATTMVGSPKQPLDWVIVGGESGPGARPCDVAWIRGIVEQCEAVGVPCFVKQLGAHAVDDRGVQAHTFPLKLKDKKGGDPAEWPADLRVREFPKQEATRA